MQLDRLDQLDVLRR